MSAPRVSIVTPAFEAQPFIARAVRSLIAQSYGDWEMIIIADDGRDYEAIVKSQGIADPRLRFAATGRVADGPGAARNVGLDLARSPIVTHLDADDTYEPGFLAAMVPAVEKHGACIGSMRMLDEKTGADILPHNKPPQDTLFSLPDLMRYCLGFANIAIDRRRCHARWPELHYGEDLLFLLLLLDDVPGIAYVSGAGFEYYCRPGSLSRPEEEGTRGLCARRERMIEWLEKSVPPVHNAANREFLKRWLHTSNAIEHIFDYTLVAADIYLAEMARHTELFKTHEELSKIIAP